VFVCSGGYNLGGDCLATLTGDDSTRRAIVFIARKHAKKGIAQIEMSLGGVYGLTGDGRRVTLYGRPTYMEKPSAVARDLHPKHRETAERIAGGLAQILGVRIRR
jgi:hypothetical protein